MDKIEKLKQLKQLFDDGILSEKEFINMKNELLNDSNKDKGVADSQTKRENLGSNTKNTVKEVFKDNVAVENQIKKEKFESNQKESVKKDEKKTVEPPTKKTSQSASLWAVSIIIILSLVLFFKPFLFDKSDNEEMEVDIDNIKTWEDLDKFITKKADEYCIDWGKACAFKNKHKRWEEQLWVDGYVNEFILGGIPSLVRDNDLPDEFITKADKLFNDRMNGCGWYLDRTQWTGGLPSSSSESEDSGNSNYQNNSSESSTSIFQYNQLPVVNGKEYIFKDVNGLDGRYIVVFSNAGKQAEIVYVFDDYKENIGMVTFLNGQTSQKNLGGNGPKYGTSSQNGKFYFYAYNGGIDDYDAYYCEE